MWNFNIHKCLCFKNVFDYKNFYIVLQEHCAANLKSNQELHSTMITPDGVMVAFAVESNMKNNN